MKEKHRQEIEGRDEVARKERDLARRSLAREYYAVLAVVKDKLLKKKKETAVAIRLQEVRARIEALTEYIEGGFELEEKLERLRDQEVSHDVDYGLASVSDPSLVASSFLRFLVTRSIKIDAKIGPRDFGVCNLLCFLTFLLVC